jgi:hypothetical protein
MRSHHVIVVAAGVLAVLAGCASRGQRITLGPGSTLSVASDADGHSEVVATIPGPDPARGIYKSKEDALATTAREAKDALGRPGVSVVITVEGEEIVAIEQTVAR